MRYLLSLIVCISFFNNCFADSLSENQIDDIVTKDASKIFGDQRENIFENNSLLRVAIPMFLQIKQAEPLKENKTIFFSGCRIHSCSEKAMVAIDENNKHMSAAALLSYECHLIPSDDSSTVDKSKITAISRKQVCNRTPLLKIFLIHRQGYIGNYSDKLLIEKFRNWATPLGYSGESIDIWE